MFINKFFYFIVNLLLCLFFFFYFNTLDLSITFINVNSLSFFLSFIPIMFLVVFYSFLDNNINDFTIFMLSISVISSIICYNITNNLYFWFFYELSILPLILLKYRGSFYSERFNALWYFIGYVSLSSFPLLFLLLLNNTFFYSNLNSNYLILLNLFLFILFILKIPLPPFHSWLPVVHAEANSFVSMVLSGYIMKLGIIGVYRYNVLIFGCNNNFLLIIFFFSLFFFINSFFELDVKRWLAFLSLSHILISFIGLNVLNFYDENIISYYCLGHGISASLLFYLFFYLNNIGGSRNWMIITNMNSNSVLFRLLLVISILTLASFPPTIQFISEVIILINSMFSYNLLILYCVYLFIGGLVPLLILSYIVSRNSNTLNLNISFSINLLLFILLFFCFFLPLLN